MIVRVSCPRCGDLALSVDEICVERSTPNGDAFRFRCEGCDTVVQKRAVGRVADMLLAAGAQPLPPPPLTLDDVPRLRADLDADDWMSRLLLA